MRLAFWRAGKDRRGWSGSQNCKRKARTGHSKPAGRKEPPVASRSSRNRLPRRRPAIWTCIAPSKPYPQRG